MKILYLTNIPTDKNLEARKVVVDLAMRVVRNTIASGELGRLRANILEALLGKRLLKSITTILLTTTIKTNINQVNSGNNRPNRDPVGNHFGKNRFRFAKNPLVPVTEGAMGRPVWRTFSMIACGWLKKLELFWIRIQRL